MVLKMVICCMTSTLENNDELVHPKQSSSPSPQRQSFMSPKTNLGSEISIHELSSSIPGSNLYVFSHDELRMITNNFTLNNFLGEGGFGAVYKGFIHDHLRPGLESQPVAVKVLDLKGTQGHKEWLTEVIYLGRLRHPNLVKLIGYSYDNDQRLLVYEYMARGNLEKHLFSRHSLPLTWDTRIKIALEAAKGLAYLHDLNKPIIFRDFKAANILLDSDYTAKLSDFGFARDGPDGDKTHVSTKNIVGTKGYTAPEYIMTGHLTTMSDVYSFGVVLLELLTGRRSMDKTRPKREQNLVDWAMPLLRDSRKIDGLMDPKLEGQYSIQGSKIAAKLTYQCINKRPKLRPRMSDVIKVLEPIVGLKDMFGGPFVYVAPCYENQSLACQVGGESVGVEEERERENKKDEKTKQEEQVKKDDYNKKALRLQAFHSDSVLYKGHKN